MNHHFVTSGYFSTRRVKTGEILYGMVPKEIEDPCSVVQRREIPGSIKNNVTVPHKGAQLRWTP